MTMLTVGQAAQRFGVSARMLRYYEREGLFKSRRREGYAYRVYDEDACVRIRQIVLMRKLRIPLRQIGEILADESNATVLKVFMRSIEELDGEITALSTIRGILNELAAALRNQEWVSLKLKALDDAALMDTLASIAPADTTIKEATTMEELNKAEEVLSKLKDVRIVYLPPATVASSHYIGPESEDHAGGRMNQFINDIKLWELKPDMRSYGFNHPNEVSGTDYHGYEFWVTIPDDLDVPEPLTKLHFPGGLYAAHMIKMGDFHEWGWLWQWVVDSPDYDMNIIDDNGERMNGLLEECLNYVNIVKTEENGGSGRFVMQLDLLIPIKPKG